MDTERRSASVWGVSRPDFRLSLVLALGAAGAYLFPVDNGFTPDAFANIRGGTLFVWMASVVASVFVLHRLEKTSMPRMLPLLMGVALVLSPMTPTGFGGAGLGRGLGGFAWLCFLLFILIMGISVIRARIPGESGSWKESLLRAPVIALTAPLLLFAIRPAACKGTQSIARRLSGMILSMLPHVIAAGFALPFFLSTFRYDTLAAGMGMAWQAFAVWSWIACALVTVLNPWPEHPGFLQVNTPGTLQKIASLATIGAVAIAILHMAILREFVFFLLFIHPGFIWGGVGCALAVILIPWPAYPAIPRLGKLSEARQMHPVSMFLFLGIGLAALGSFAFRPFLSIISGQLFASTFNGTHTGGALDSPSLHKWFHLFTFFSAMVLPYVAAARWMGGRGSRLGYWAFTIPAVALCMCLLSILTVPFYWLLQYIAAMGCTFRRLYGLGCGLAGYAIVLAFLCWAVWPSPGEKREPGGSVSH